MDLVLMWVVWVVGVGVAVLTFSPCYYAEPPEMSQSPS